MSGTLTYRRIGGTPANTTAPSPWPWNPGDRLLSGGMTPVGRKDFEEDGLTAGMWACNAGTVEITGHPVNEVCFVVHGFVTITDSTGRAETFRVGEGFLLPCGFSGIWSNSDDFAKLLVAVDNDARRRAEV